MNDIAYLRLEVLAHARTIAQRPTFVVDKNDYLQLPLAYQGAADKRRVSGCLLGVLVLAAIELHHFNGPPDEQLYFPRQCEHHLYYAIRYSSAVEQLRMLGFSLYWLNTQEARFLAAPVSENDSRLQLIHLLDEALGLQGRSRSVPGHAYSLS
jgi:hypothetical protein